MLEAQRRSFVEIAAGNGMEVEQIGLLLNPPCDAETLKTRYALELETGPAKANYDTVQLLRNAVKKGNVTAMIYWTKARMGWTERGPSLKNLAELEDNQTLPPTKMPDASTLEAKILGFPGRSSRRS